jgi:hypothetical protein
VQRGNTSGPMARGRDILSSFGADYRGKGSRR